MVVLLVLFLMISAFLAGSETALFSLSSLKVKVFKQDHRHLVATLLEKPKELLVTILIVNIAVNILVQNIISNIFAAENSWLLSVGLPLLLVLFFWRSCTKVDCDFS